MCINIYLYYCLLLIWWLLKRVRNRIECNMVIFYLLDLLKLLKNVVSPLL